MDMSMMTSSLNMLRSSLSIAILDKAMGKDAQTMATMISDMQAGIPAPQLAAKVGSMDISV